MMTREEAIEVYNGLINTKIKEAFEFFAPELRESEDERIRKKCIELIKRVIPSGDSQSQESKEILDCIAYLEKQKCDRMKPIYDARESFESALEKAWNDYHNGYENVDKLEDDYVECAHAKGFREGYLFGLEKQKEQKPNFSEKDSTDFEIEVHEIIAQARSDSRLNDADVLKQFEEEAAFALMLKANKLIEQKSAEWNEEDEEKINDIFEIIEHCVAIPYSGGTLTLSKEYKKELQCFIKSLRPSWKPNKEQMKALADATMRDVFPVGYRECLETLYEQLKKLYL